jgi:hypothetical protein
MIHPTDHALDRYRELHPTAEASDLLAALMAGVPMSPGVLWAITQRRGQPSSRDRYVHVPGGCFTIRWSGPDEVVVTFLRFSPAQEKALSLGLRTPVVTLAQVQEYAKSILASMNDGSVPRAETVRKLAEMVVGVGS